MKLKILNPTHDVKRSRELITEAKAAQRHGEELIEAGKNRKGRKWLGLAGELYEESGDKEMYINRSARNYAFAATMYFDAGEKEKLRDVYSKQLEHYKTLLRAAIEAEDMSLMRAYHSRTIIVEEGIKLLNPVRNRAIKTSAPVRRMVQKVGHAFGTFFSWFEINEPE